MSNSYAKVKEWRSRPENKHKRAEEAARWRKRHPELAKKLKREHRARHLERIRKADRDAQRKRREQDPEAAKRRSREWTARRDAKRETDAGRKRAAVCEVCSEHHIRIVWDHDHSTGEFRGWICDRCNRVLGLVYDNAVLLIKLSRYLKKELPWQNSQPENETSSLAQLLESLEAENFR